MQGVGQAGRVFLITAPPKAVLNQDNHKTLIIYLEETDSSPLPTAKYPEDSGAFRLKERRNHQDVLGALFVFSHFSNIQTIPTI